MSLQWIKENPAHWDEEKERIVGGAQEGIFELGPMKIGDVVPGIWWCVKQSVMESPRVLGFGWMDCSWGEAEVLLAVDPQSEGKGVGTFIMDQLEKEASSFGYRYLVNIVRPSHPERQGITAWLKERGFVESEDGRLMRRVLHESALTD